MKPSRIGLRHIEGYRAVMICGTMTEAAFAMHTSQPQVSRLIAQLEEVTQFRLFERKGSRLKPTSEGLRFYQEVQVAYEGLAGLEAAAANIRDFRNETLHVAAMPRLAGGVLVKIVVSFKQEFPEVMVSIHSGDAATVHQRISTGLCETGLAMLYGATIGMNVESVVATECVAVLPPGHRLANQPMLRPADFVGEKFIDATPGRALRKNIDQIFSAAGVQRVTVAEAGLGASVCGLVAAGLGASVVNPLAAAEERRHTGITVRPFEPRIPITIGLLYPPFVQRKRLVEVFSRHARQILCKELLQY